MSTKSLKFAVMLLGIALGMFACNGGDPEPVNTNGTTTAVFNPGISYGTMTDQEGNVYKTVTIGTQTWMAENLRTTIYNDSTAIPHVPGNAEWSALTSGGYCVFQNNTDKNFIATYGNLYNFQAINSGKLAPAGWHVSTDTDWNTLVNFLGGNLIAGKKLKEVGTTHWVSYSIPATNESGFTGLPGSNRALAGTFPSGVGTDGEFWTATPHATTAGWVYSWYLNYGKDEVSRIAVSEERGLSVRLVKD